MLYGLWEVAQHNTGSMPDAREGAAACVLGNNFYMFGGFSRGIFNDMRVLDTQKMKWKLIAAMNGEPAARFSHSMVAYKNKLYIFGGAGAYVSSIKMRLSFNDLLIFDTKMSNVNGVAGTWTKVKSLDNEGDIPSKRMNHTATILGCVMVIHGGFNTERKRVLNDFSLYDIEQSKWMNCKIFTQDESGSIERITDRENQKIGVGYRQMHTLTAVYD